MQFTTLFEHVNTIIQNANYSKSDLVPPVITANHPDLKNHYQNLAPNQFFYLIHLPSNTLLHGSNNIESLLGYKQDEFNYQSALINVHPEDQKLVYRAMEKTYELGCGTQILDKTMQSVLTINYRFRKADGTYIHLIRNSLITKLDSEGRILQFLSICTDITDLKYDSIQSGKIVKNGEVLYKISNQFDDVENAVLSTRELEVYDRLRAGKTSQEIARELFISKHTVDTHRRKIIRKLNIHDTRLLLKMN
ncbi:hypothetical protein DMA11_16560 [Marinilabiliaceae bacterium JC017]|nr:hypothetical protein DMA11_16560 [Marinilabiliaceae bacterium JC017]